MFRDRSGGRRGGAVDSHLNSPVCVVISDVHQFVPATYNCAGAIRGRTSVNLTTHLMRSTSSNCRRYAAGLVNGTCITATSSPVGREWRPQPLPGRDGKSLRNRCRSSRSEQTRELIDLMRREAEHHAVVDSTPMWSFRFRMTNGNGAGMVIDGRAVGDRSRGGSLKSSWYGGCLPERDFPTRSASTSKADSRWKSSSPNASASTTSQNAIRRGPALSGCM